MENIPQGRVHSEKDSKRLCPPPVPCTPAWGGDPPATLHLHTRPPGPLPLKQGRRKECGCHQQWPPQGPLDQVQRKSLHFLVWGASLDLVQSWGNAIFQTGPWTQSSVSSPGLWPHVTASGAPSATGSPLAVTWGQAVDAVCQADGSWRVKRDSCDLFHC